METTTLAQLISMFALAGNTTLAINYPNEVNVKLCSQWNNE